MRLGSTASATSVMAALPEDPRASDSRGKDQGDDGNDDSGVFYEESCLRGKDEHRINPIPPCRGPGMQGPQIARLTLSGCACHAGRRPQGTR